MAADIHRICHLTGTFVLRSGQTANFYFDKYRFESDPRLLERVCDALAPLVPSDTEVLAGLELGGIPIVTGLSRVTGIPAAFVRKKAKDYGTARLAEGTPVEGRRVTMVEDVVTSGGQLVLSATDLRHAGALVTHALCVIDREQGGTASVASQGIELRSLFTAAELSAAASA